MKRASATTTILAAFALLGLGFAPAAFAQSVLRVGDNLEIRLSGVPPEEMGAFSATYMVDEAGMLNLPYIGLIKASGLQANQLQQNVENRLKAEEIFTHPTIVVTIANGNRFVNVRGAVRAPQRIVYTPDMTFMLAITAAGGLGDFAGKKARFSRDGKATIIDIKKIISDPSKDFPVRPGDQIEVLESMLGF